VPKPNVAELVELNKQEQGKVDSADEDWRRQVWTRKPAPPDCASGSGIDCGSKSVPPVAAMSKEHLPTTGRRPTGPNQEQRQQQQAGNAGPGTRSTAAARDPEPRPASKAATASHHWPWAATEAATGGYRAPRFPAEAETARHRRPGRVALMPSLN
jgi:hypothetical protein